eukprot:COSAG05_NODE_2679_length_2775_cov_6.918161_4_plen_86_part_00
MVRGRGRYGRGSGLNGIISHLPRTLAVRVFSIPHTHCCKSSHLSLIGKIRTDLVFIIRPFFFSSVQFSAEYVAAHIKPLLPQTCR